MSTLRHAGRSLLFLLLSGAVLAAPRHTVLLREAAVAAKAGDSAAALARTEEAAKLRPDYPRVQLNLARLYAALQRPDAALAALQRLADMGLQLDVTADPGLTALKELPRFQALAARLGSGPAPVGSVAEFSLPAATGIIECCLEDPVTQARYFSDVRHRCIWRTGDPAHPGPPQKFTHDGDALDGVFRLALSADRRTLWAATATVGAMAGADAEDGKRSALVAIDFASGRVRARYPVPTDGRKHLLGDFVIAADGSIYATDSMAPVIWRLPSGGTALEPWLESDDFLSLQGIAFAAGERELYVADYANGIWRIESATKACSLLSAPPDATFFGIDGLYTVPGGLLAVQNGVNPQRVLRLAVPAAKSGNATATVVAQGRANMTDLALGQVLAGRFQFVANSGWALFDPPPAAPPPPRAVTILSTSLE